MGRKYSIGFLLVIIIVIILFAAGNYLSEKEPDKYLIKNVDGYETEYLNDGSVYEYTTILSSDLPDSIRNGINYGIEMNEIEEVYGFLENYSS